jgi:hypothetical protein
MKLQTATINPGREPFQGLALEVSLELGGCFRPMPVAAARIEIT